MKLIYIIATLILITACQPTLIRSDNNYFAVNPNSTIEITQEIEVHPNSARAFLQYGEVQPNGKINLYEVNCEVQINTVSETRQIIQPDIFKVISIRQEESPIVMFKPVMVASLNLAGKDDSYSPVDIKRYYHFKLSPQEANSSSQVRAIICRGAQAEPYRAELPSLKQMKQASGDFLQFNF